MALIGFEGFDNEATIIQNDLIFLMPFGTGNVTVPANGFWDGFFSGFGTLSKVAGLLGGFALGSNTTTAAGGLQLNANYATIICGFRYRVRNPPLIQEPIITFMDGNVSSGGTAQCGLSIGTNGKLFFWRGTTATVLGTGTTTLVAGGWYMIEVQVTIDNAVGAFQVNLGGVSELSGAGIDTQTTANAYTNGLQISIPASTVIAYDDFYVCDTTGPAPYNTFLGIIRVETLYPTANNSVTWTPSAGANWQCVDKVSAAATPFNSQAATGIDLFSHGALSSVPVTVFAVDVCSYAYKSDVKAVSYRNKLVSGASSSNGVSDELATSASYTRDSYLNDPNTAAPWTGANVNATLIGYERVS